MDRHKVIFDTDPGVDDAMALMLLHLHPQIDLVGITTVYGNATIEDTTRNALYMAERFGIDAPVARGAGQPLVAAPKPTPAIIHGHNGLGDIELPSHIARQADPRDAIAFMADMVRAHPGEITIVAVGRMTNMALFARAHPDLVPLVKQVVIMGGVLGTRGISGNVSPVAEANIAGDPHAADEMFHAPWHVVMVGLDVTKKTVMTPAQIEEIKTRCGEMGYFLWDTSRLYMEFHERFGVAGFFVHDSSAVAYVVAPELFTVQTGPIRVADAGVAVGQTIQRPDGQWYPPGPWDDRPSHTACLDVDGPGVMELIMTTFLSA